MQAVLVLRNSCFGQTRLLRSGSRPAKRVFLDPSVPPESLLGPQWARLATQVVQGHSRVCLVPALLLCNDCSPRAQLGPESAMLNLLSVAGYLPCGPRGPAWALRGSIRSPSEVGKQDPYCPLR